MMSDRLRRVVPGTPAGTVATLSRYVWGGLVVFVCLCTMLMTVRTYVPVPQWDSWGYVTIADHVANLFVSHDRHIITVPHLLYIVDKWLFAGSAVFDLTVTLLLLLGDAALLAWVARRADLPFVFRGFVFMALLWAYPVNNFLSGFNVQIIGVFVIATASFAVLAFRRERGVAGAIALALVASFTMANGILTGVLLAPLALALGLSRRAVVATGVAGVAMVAVYALLSHGGTDVLCADVYRTGVTPDLFSLTHIGEMLSYAGVYLGAPIGRLLFRAEGLSATAMAGTAAIGFGALSLSLFLAVRAFFDDRLRRKPEVLFLIALLLFLLGTAAVTAFGRAGGCPLYSAATSRYGTSAVMFWTVLVLLAGMVKLSSARWASLLPALGAAAFGLVIAASQPVIVKAMIVSPGMGPSDADQRTEQFLGAGRQADRVGAETAILSNVRDLAALRFIMIPEPVLLERIPVLRAERFAPFDHDWTRLLGTPISGFATARDTACRGAVDTVEPIRAGGWRIGGTLDRGTTHASTLLVASADGDGGGVVVGYALRSPGRSLVEASLDRNPRWQGHVNGAARGAVTVYALDPGAKTVCAVAKTTLAAR